MFDNDKLNEFLKNYGKNSSLEQYAEKATQDLSKKRNFEFFNLKKDSRFWWLSTDDNGNGAAIIRFLDVPRNPADPEQVPWSKYFAYNWGHINAGWNKKRFYCEVSRSTIGKKDPCDEQNAILYGMGKSGETIAKSRRKQEYYISNILVVKDFANPANNGQIFLYRYTKTIFKKIKESFSPDPMDIELYGKTAFDPFNYLTGANFVLRSTKDDNGVISYDKSEFQKQEPLLGGDMKKIANDVIPRLVDLSEFRSEPFVKSYEDLQGMLIWVLGDSYIKGEGNGTTVLENDDPPVPYEGQVPSTSPEEEYDDFDPAYFEKVEKSKKEIIDDDIPF